MYGSADGKKQFKFVYGVLVITSKAQAPNFEESFKVEKNSEGNFDIVVVGVVSVPWSLVVFEVHCRCCDTICEDNAHDEHSKLGGTQNCVTER